MGYRDIPVLILLMCLFWGPISLGLRTLGRVQGLRMLGLRAEGLTFRVEGLGSRLRVLG